MKPIIYSTYLIPVFGDFKSVVNVLCGAIKKDINSFDSIACCGMSGAMVAPTIAMMLDKNLALVRKENDKRHSHHNVEGKEGVKNYIIIDDGIDEGGTMDFIIARMRWRYPASFPYKIYLYNQNDICDSFHKNNYKKVPVVFV